MSCPPEFPAIAAITALAIAVGSRVHCKPYKNGTWVVPGGAWAMIVSPPSAIKSPPLSEMLRPLKLLDKVAADHFKLAMQQYVTGDDVWHVCRTNDIAVDYWTGVSPIMSIPARALAGPEST